MKSLILLSIIPLCLLAQTVMATPIQGVIKRATDQAPIAGVSIDVEASGKKVKLPQLSGSDGQFGFDPSLHFNAEERDTFALTLNFNKAGFRSVTRVLRSQQRGTFNHQNLQVKMERTAGSSAIEASHQAAIAQNKSHDGRTLYFMPYTLEFEQSGPDPSSFHRIFKFQLKRGINSHLTSLDVEAGPNDISVVTMPVEIDAGNTEQVRAYGSALNALGIVSGFGLQADQQALGVSSEYLVIPALNEFHPPTLYVDDNFQSNELRSSRLFERLNTLWGQNTVLALSLREIQVALANNDNAGLQRAREYLMAEKRQAGPDSDLLVRNIDALLTWIDGRLDQ